MNPGHQSESGRVLGVLDIVNFTSRFDKNFQTFEARKNYRSVRSRMVHVAFDIYIIIICAIRYVCHNAFNVIAV